jgi:hypothetical protein
MHLSIDNITHLLYNDINITKRRERKQMEQTKLKTTEAQRKAVREYEKKNDRINVIFPAGTKNTMKALGIEKPNAFIKEVVAAELERMKKYKK